MHLFFLATQAVPPWQEAHESSSTFDGASVRVASRGSAYRKLLPDSNENPNQGYPFVRNFRC